MKIRVISRFKVAGSSNLDAETDQLHEALLAREKLDSHLSSADITVTLAQRLVSISIVVDAQTWDEAGEVGSAVIVSAIESVGGRVTVSEPISDVADFGRPVAHASPAHLEARIQSTQLVPA